MSGSLTSIVRQLEAKVKLLSKRLDKAEKNIIRQSFFFDVLNDAEKNKIREKYMKYNNYVSTDQSHEVGNPKNNDGSS